MKNTINIRLWPASSVSVLASTSDQPITLHDSVLCKFSCCCPFVPAELHFPTLFCLSAHGQMTGLCNNNPVCSRLYLTALGSAGSYFCHIRKLTFRRCLSGQKCKTALNPVLLRSLNRDEKNTDHWLVGAFPVLIRLFSAVCNPQFVTRSS
jgi:hypothetical protein